MFGKYQDEALKKKKIVSKQFYYNKTPETDSYPVGYVYLKDVAWKLLCNTVLLHPRWSVGPAHCVAIRTDPDMADFLFSWRIRYANRNIKFVDDFRNNVGLFEHETPIQIKYFDLVNSVTIDDDLLLQHSNSLALRGWMINSTFHADKSLELVSHEVQPVSTTKCVRFMAPILDIRDYEYLLYHAWSKEW